MVSIVAGAGLGLAQTSAKTLGSGGVFGTQTQGFLGSNYLINASSGNVIIQNQDEVLTGVGQDVVLTRTYNSLGQSNDDNGDNWRQSVQRSVSGLTGTVNAAGSTISRTDFDGSVAIYTYDATRSAYVFHNPAGDIDTLTYSSASNRWTWTGGVNRVVEVYDNANAGRILSSTDTDGKALTFTYTGTHLTRVTDSNGEYVALSWSGNNITQLSTYKVDGTLLVSRVRYGYDTSNRLTSVTVDLSPADNSVTDNYTVTYAYTYEGTSNRVTSISETGSNAMVAFQYDATSHKVTKVTETASSGDVRVTNIDYSVANHTRVTDAQNNITNYGWDGQGRLTSVTYPTGQTLGYAWDAVTGKVSSVIDALGYTTLYTYDANGNLIRVLDPAGGQIDRTYDAANNLLTETHYQTLDPDGAGPATASGPMTTRYVYNAQNHLRFVISGQGQVTEYRYNAAGQQVSSLNWTANTYDISSLAVGAAPSEATMASWVSGIADASTVERSDFAYDFRGNLATSTAWTAADATGNGLTSATRTVTTFVYDQYGLLLSRQISGRTGSEVYTYDGLGRMNSSTDLAGNLTRIAFDNVNHRSVITLANGQSTTSSFNQLGQIVGKTVAGDGVTSQVETYKYDSLGRLRATLDAASKTDYTFYDAVGREVGYMDRLGNLTEFQYDNDNRLIATIKYATAISASGLASLFDAGGNPQNVAFPSIRPASSNLDDWNFNIYDAAGHVVQSIETVGGNDGTSPQGRVTTYTYDGEGKLVKTAASANLLSASVMARYKTAVPNAYNLIPNASLDNGATYWSQWAGDGITFTQQPTVTTDPQGNKLVTTAFQASVANVGVGLFTDITAPVQAGQALAVNQRVYASGSVSEVKVYVEFWNANGSFGSAFIGSATSGLAGGVTISGVVNAVPAGTTSLRVITWAIPSSAGSNGTFSVGNASVSAISNLTGPLNLLPNPQLDGTQSWGQYGPDGITFLQQPAVTTDGQGNKSITTSFQTNSTSTSAAIVADTRVDVVPGQDLAISSKVSGSGALGSITVFVEFWSDSGWLGNAWIGVATSNFANGVTISGIAHNIPAGTTYARLIVWGSASAVNTPLTMSLSNSSVEYIPASTPDNSPYLLPFIQIRNFSATPLAAATDRVTRNFYDNAGELVGVLDADGALTRTSYDGAGRVIKTVRYATLAAANLRANGSLADLVASVTASANPADRTEYFAYDGQGNLRYTLDANLRPTETVYDAAGAPIRTVSYSGPIASTTGLYTASYIQSQITALGLAANAATRTTRVVYDGAGRKAFEINAEGDVVGYAYNNVGQVVKVIRYANVFASAGDQTLAQMQSWASGNGAAGDRVSRIVYDGLGRAVYEVDGEGYVTEHQYDQKNQVVKDIRYPAAQAVSDSVTKASLASQIGGIPANAVVQTYVYDAVGNRTQVTDGAGIVTRYTFDAFGNVTLITNVTSGSVTNMVYDASGRIMRKTTAYGSSAAATVTYAYDGVGNLLTSTDARGYTTSYTYDAMGNLLTQNVPLTVNPSTYVVSYAVTTRQYDAFGNVVTVTDPRGSITWSYYDKLGRLAWQVDNEGYGTQTQYSIGDAITSVTRFATRPSGTGSTTLLPTFTTSSSDAVTRFTLDRLDRITATTDAGGYTESYGLNAFGQRVSVTNKLGGITTNVYDKRGLLTQETLPVGSTRSDGTVATSNIVNTYQYDANGNLTKKVEAVGLAEQRTTIYAYDLDNRLISKTSDAVTTVDGWTMAQTSGVAVVERYKYDANGNMIEKDDANGNQTLSWYDAGNRKVAELSPLGQLTAWTYDANGNVMSSRVYGDLINGGTSGGGNPPAAANGANFRETDYGYDANNRLTTTTVIGNGAGVAVAQYQGTSYAPVTRPITTTLQYDADGNVIVQTDGNGGKIYSWYDKLGHKIAQVDQSLYMTRWTFDQEGNVTAETRYATPVTGNITADGNPPTTPVLDGLNDRTTLFTYDRNGRRLTETRLNVKTASVSGQGISEATVSATVTYTYNGLGLVTSKREATGDTTNYGYDQSGRQTSITGPAFTDYTGATVSNLQQMSYDGLGNVTRSVENGSRVIQYSYGSEGRLASTTDALGNVTSYSYDAGGRISATTSWLVHSDGSGQYVARALKYDAAGHEISENTFTSGDGSNWNLTYGAATDYFYDAYGEVVARGTNSGRDMSKAQEFNDYDAAGRVWRTNFGNGVTKAYIYDANGNATVLLQSMGSVNLKNGSGYDGVADAQAMLGNSGISKTFSVYDARNQLTDTVQATSNNAGASQVNATATPMSENAGVQYFYTTANSAGGSHQYVGDASSQVSSNSATLMNGSGWVQATGGIRKMSGNKPLASYTVNYPITWSNLPIHGGGGQITFRNQNSPYDSFTTTSPSGSWYPYYTATRTGFVPEQTYVITQTLPSGATITLGSLHVHFQDDDDIWNIQDSVTAFNPSFQLSGEDPSVNSVRLWVRPQGSSGPYTFTNMSPLIRDDGNVEPGMFTYDMNQPPFNGAGANSSWDIRYYAFDGNGSVRDAKNGTLTVDGNGNPSVNLNATPVGGAGQTLATWDGPYYTLLFTGLPPETQHLHVYYRLAGSSGGFINLDVNPQARGGAYGQSGWWSGRPPADGQTYEYWVQPEDGNGTPLGVRSYGTYNSNSGPGGLTQYSPSAEFVDFYPPSGAPVTSQRMRYYNPANGSWSDWMYTSSSGQWHFDASWMAPDFYSSYSYSVEYETYNGSTLLSQLSGNLTLGYGGANFAVTGRINNVPAQVVFDPLQKGGSTIKLYWREVGSGQEYYNPVTMTRNASGQYVWDIDGGGVHPDSGTKHIEYYYDIYDAGGNKLNTLTGTDHVQGNMDISSDHYVSASGNEIRWSINTANSSQYLVHRQQSYDAFGDIVSETDGRGNITRLVYNTEGKLIQKIAPQVSVTDEAGNTSLTNPTEYYYYDASGRQVAQRDANGNLTTQLLLAGTGYGGTQAKATTTYLPGSTSTNGYDVWGDLRKVTDGLGNVTANVYDANHNLVEVDHAQRSGGNSNGVQLRDYYAYDVMGQRIKHWNSQYGAGVVETTDYDVMGRVTRTVSMAGQVTDYGYYWYPGIDPQGGDAHISTIGLGAFGGWQKITGTSAGVASFENTDIFGNLSWRQDFGGRWYSYSYDLTGHLIQQTNAAGQNITYSYYENGYVKSINDNTLHMLSTFQYDNDGNRTLETYNSTNAAGVTDGTSVFYQNAKITYDAMNRMVEFKDPKADITYKYDAVGNRRNVHSVYVDGVGNSLIAPQDYWYKYDGQNRFVLTMGSLVNGSIVVGNAGVALTYDAAGNRTTASYGYDGHSERYSYTADGYLENTWSTPSGQGEALIAARTDDALGRVVQYTEYNGGGVSLSRSSSYDGDNRVVTDTTNSVSNSVTTTTVQSYDYKAWNASTGNYSGSDQGVVTHIHAVQTQSNNSGSIVTDTRYNYVWWDEAKQSTIRIDAVDPSNPNSWAPGVSDISYDQNGHANVLIDHRAVGGATTTTYKNDAYGQVLVREKWQNGAIGPRQLYYYFDGKRIGDVGNDGRASSQVDYAQQLAQTASAKQSGLYRYGKPVASADFDENYQPINAGYPSATAGNYTVNSGDTLQTIASSLWGDSSLWYLLADANGIGMSTQLVAGQRLIVPNKVTNFHNNTSTFKVYNPGEAIGDTLPTLPNEPAPPPTHSNAACGGFGAILLAVVAVAVTAVTAGAAIAAVTPGLSLGAGIGAAAGGGLVSTFGVAGGIAIGAGAAALGSVVSQGLGVATGLQSNFNWNAVGMAALGGAVGGAGLNVNAFGAGAVAKVANMVVTGALRSAVVQGVGVATGLQSSFDWGGVAAAGVGAGIGGHNVIGNMASGIAASAAESLVTGRDFGDTITANLPSMIANTIGNYLSENIAGSKTRANPSQAAQDPNAITVTIDHAQLGRAQTDAAMLFDDSQSASVLGADGTTVAALARREAIVKAMADGATPATSKTSARYSGYVDVVDAGNVYSYGMLAAREATLDTFFAANPNSPDKDKAYAAIAHNRDIIAQGNAVADGEEIKLLAMPVGAALLAGGAVVAPGAFSAGQGFVYSNALRISIASSIAADIGAGTQVNSYYQAAPSIAAAAETAAPRAGTALQTYWPPNRGFQGASMTEDLAVGARIDRYGYEGGTFLSPQGTPDWMRSLAPGTTSKPYNIYEVTSPIQVQSGKAAPWFGQVGQGTQYELPMSVSDAIAKGYIKRVGP